ncbi:zinc finger MYM-type protein 1-like [Rhopalosiphum maidis]|uniref:zinc finger MYM-type protein 1-like n=1 Tax=Rhopalosiphum maidis TaxID=43146 RepID=UPI000EFF73AE|nr:zinc finger MYM-type protein 1-like [Rhopalosiphum maidis]
MASPAVNIDPDDPVPFAQNNKVIVEQPKTDHDNWSNTVNVPVPLDSLCDPDDPVNPIPSLQLERKERILKGAFQPKLKMYPRTQFGNRARSFQSSWYDDFSWLEYSVKLDRAFCFVCRMFNTAPGLNAGQVDFAFSQKGFKNWSTSTTKFKKHQNSISHNFSMTAYHNFSNCKPIDVTLDESRLVSISEREKQRLHNRNIMHRLIDITLCLAKSGKPFRGHLEKSSDVCKGLFLDIVDILKKYDLTLQKLWKKGRKMLST